MSRSGLRRGLSAGLLILLAVAGLCGCADFQGLNSFPLPGTEGGGRGSYTVQAQLPDVHNVQVNSRVRVRDVNVGSISKIEVQGWHALITMRLNGDVDLPANATATIGQTSLLGSLHIELAPPVHVASQGKLIDGSLIPLSSGGSYPSTEQTLAAVSLVLNGGALGQLHSVIEALSTAFTGREQDLRSLIGELDTFVGYLDDQKDDIIAATDGLNNLVGQFADQKPIIDKALKTIPNALSVLKDERDNLAEALKEMGRFGGLAADSVNQTKENLVKELKDLGPVIQSLADTDSALTRSLDELGTLPFPGAALKDWIRGDAANLTGIFDLTLSRLDTGFFTGTKWECDLTELELQWGRTIGQLSSPCTAGGRFNPGNPLVVPYHFNQGW